MQVNYYRSNLNQTFTGIKIGSGADDVIKSLCRNGLNDLNKMVDESKSHEYVDLMLFGNGKNSLRGRIVGNGKLNYEIFCEKSQRFWETPIDFITKMYKKTLNAEKNSEIKHNRLEFAKEIINKIK